MKYFAAGAALGGVGAWLVQKLRHRLTGDSYVTVERGVAALRPQPSGELIVQIDAPMRIIAIFTASEDAAEWIYDQAPLYGTLYEPEEAHAPFILVVSPFFNPMTVGHFLFVGYHEGVIDDDSNDSIFLQ